MKVGIVGRAGAGRSTVFEAVTGLAPTPHAQVKVRLGVARVVDPRVAELTALCSPKRTVRAEVTLALPPNTSGGPIDVAAVRELRDLVAYVHVVGCFGAEDAGAEATAQIAQMTQELVLADMERADSRRVRLAKGAAARPGEAEALDRAAAQLDRERPLRLLDWDESARKLLDELGLMSQRPLLTVLNVAEERLAAGLPDAVRAQADAVGSQVLWLCATLEREIADLDLDAQREFLVAYDLQHPVAHRFVRSALALLDQICFFTVGPDEVRAWTIPRHANARRAARSIHSDLEKGFIRAEVIDYDAFLACGSEARCRTAGKLRVEGKDYEVKDGDIITIRFNV